MSKKRRPSKLRFFISLFAFLIGSAVLIAVFVVPFFIEPIKFYFLIPLCGLVILDFIFGLFILNSNSQINFRATWLAVVLVFPFIGIFCYLLFANKFTTKRMKIKRYNKINKSLKESQINSSLILNQLKDENGDAYSISNYLYKNTYSSIFNNTEMEYYSFGQYGFPEILKELKKAKRFIFIEYFIIAEGCMFDQIYKILKDKVSEGVDVRLIYDDFGSVGRVHANFYKQAIKDGIKCYAFNRIRPLVDIRQNSRDHRKIIVIDGIVGFTGGCNLADEYINVLKRFGVWRDNFIKLKGKGVNGLTNLFLSSRSLFVKEDLEPNKYSYLTNCDLEVNNIVSQSIVVPFGEAPFDGEDGARNTFLQLISRAKKYIYISTPYLIPDEETITAIQIAAKSGIEVIIVTPGIPDKKMVYSVTRSYYAKLLLAGVRIYEYTPGFNHTKMIVVDDIMAITGTINMDYRSFYLHFENGVYLYNDECIIDMKNDILDMVKVGKEQTKEEYLNKPLIKRIIWSFLRLFAPLI